MKNNKEQTYNKNKKQKIENNLNEKNINQSRTYTLFKSFTKNLKENKVYLISFFITSFFLILFSLNKVKDATGLYNNSTNNQNTETSNNSSSSNNVNASLNSDFDISAYLGIYTRDITLTSKVIINDTCTIDSYSFVYQVNKDKTISKYFTNDCLGTIKVWEDEAKYLNSNGAKYINAHDINYLFSNTNMKELNGNTYSLNASIKTIKENLSIKDIEINFYNDNIVIMSNDNLLLITNSNTTYSLNEAFPNNGGNLNKRVYKSKENDTYNFIVFNNGEKVNCYNDANNKDKEDIVYQIYSIKYNVLNNKFDTPLEKVSRNKGDSCTIYNDDLSLLNE